MTRLHVHPHQLELLAQLRRQGHPLDPRALAALELEVDPAYPPEGAYLVSELLEVRPRDPDEGLLPRPRPGTQLQTYASKKTGWAVFTSPLLEEVQAVVDGLRAKITDPRERLLEFPSLDPPSFSFAEAIERELKSTRQRLFDQLVHGTFSDAHGDAYSAAFGGRWEPPPPATPEQLAEASDPATAPARLEQLLNAPQAPLRHLAAANVSLPGEALRPLLRMGEPWAWLNPTVFVEALGVPARQLECGTREAVLGILSRYWPREPFASWRENLISRWRRDPLTTTSTLVRRARVATRKRLGGGYSPDELTADQARTVIETVALVLGL